MMIIPCWIFSRSSNLDSPWPILKSGRLRVSQNSFLSPLALCSFFFSLVVAAEPLIKSGDLGRIPDDLIKITQATNSSPSVGLA